MLLLIDLVSFVVVSLTVGVYVAEVDEAAFSVREIQVIRGVVLAICFGLPFVALWCHILLE